MGLPFVTSSDLVSAYPAKSLEVADYVDDLIPLLAMTQNAQTGVTYSFVLADFTKLVTLSNASAIAVTLPLEATVAWPTGTQLRLLNVGAGTVTVAGAAGVTINGTPLTLAQYKGANLIKTATNTWVFIPFGSGVGAADFSDAATGTYTGFKYLTFSASGTINISTAGFADLILVGGGGGGSQANGGGGGAGGALVITDAYLPVGALTVTIGAGGAAAASSGISGNPSRVGSFYSPQGGGGAVGGEVGENGASGGGGKNSGAGGAGTSSIGNNGGAGSAPTGVGGAGGGGGATSVGVAGTTSVGGGNGGTGTSTTIAGTTPTGAYVAGSYAFSGGGGGGSVGGAGGTATDGGGNGSGSTTGTNGSANKGGGGGGGGGGAALGGAGGSGIVIVRVGV